MWLPRPLGYMMQTDKNNIFKLDLMRASSETEDGGVRVVFIMKRLPLIILKQT